ALLAAGEVDLLIATPRRGAVRVARHRRCRGHRGIADLAVVERAVAAELGGAGRRAAVAPDRRRADGDHVVVALLAGVLDAVATALDPAGRRARVQGAADRHGGAIALLDAGLDP